MDNKEIGFQGVDLFHLAQDSFHWWTLQWTLGFHKSSEISRPAEILYGDVA
jgi:hypothetical protein